MLPDWNLLITLHVEGMYMLGSMEGGKELSVWKVTETRGSAESLLCQNMLLLNITAPKEGGKGQLSGLSH